MRNWRVDFKKIGKTPNLNRVVFTFTLADTAEKAIQNIYDAHGNVEILEVARLQPQKIGDRVEP